MPPRRLRPELRFLCALGVAVALAAWGAARYVVPWVGSHPLLARLVARPCAFKALTGVPCPLCGGTRAAVHAARGRWFAAFLANPLGAAVVLSALVGGAWLGACAVTGFDLGLSAFGRRARALPPGRLIAAVLVGLWTYKIASERVFALVFP